MDLQKIKNNEDHYLFIDEDYDTFSEDLWHSKEMEINRRRNAVKSKLIQIHEAIESQVLALGLNRHWNIRNITALPYITPRTENTGINWLGLRYGRDKDTIKLMTRDIPKISDEDQEFSFLKFQCIQVGISYSGMEITMFHSSSSNNTFDRGYLHDNLENNEELKTKISDAIENLKGFGVKWYIGNQVFDIDSSKYGDFVKFYNLYDLYNTYSFGEVFIPRWDKRLQKDQINDTVIEYIKLLSELYEAMKWNPNI